jgi:hypothetical protein
MVYWSEPGDAVFPLGDLSPTTAGGFPSRTELLDRYASGSSRDVSDIGYWRLACITLAAAAHDTAASA